MRPASVTAPEGTYGDTGFRGLISVSFGTADARTADGNDGQLRHDFHFDWANTQALSQLRSAIELACVGVHVVLTGPPADIMAAAAVAADCGLVEEEVTLLSDGSRMRTVFCAHCRTATETVEPVGSEFACQGCATVLAISDHFSRRLAAYLGFAAHAEEAA
ncbi:dimethylamine monooxygenase subunit DmmA family protein [Arthrobacter sp. H14-L1]|uniref:dimethylamine monooxygenase subunit DmmA family protein n=1 Tax=Arthrobacter sp. H14-L1 TaxID=2996697 RepID=UPI0022717C68|nr:dimethylamine monooxygenase subunit DmmA family protein [Arthrobacter sp. H14-L1]MCY0906719.1 dimethylamine monooxygenase subunit DmmA family protein [Arthrobacter sp. H14-L1]